MNNVFLKIRLWTKVVLFSLLALYILVFISKNSSNSAKFWYWINHEPETPMLYLVGITFAAGILSTLIVRTTFTTIRQYRELKARNRIERLERSNAEIKAKAAMLQRSSPSATIVAPPTTPGVTDAE